LPPVEVLREKKRAYAEMNSGLAKRVADLKNRSAELEATYRKVISLCSGCSEEEVDHNLGAMITAIEAEGEREKDPTRVREFMRKYGKGEMS
jgi:regulatory protein SWI6